MRLWKRLSVPMRLALLSAITLILGVGVSIYLSVTTAEEAFQDVSRQHLATNMAMLQDALAAYGPPKRVGDKLYFGDTLINGNFLAVDRVKAIAGGTATVFMGDERVATNVTKPDGSRAVGTRLTPGPVYDAVLKDGKIFAGEADILGENYLTTYAPILSQDKPIGIFYVGVRKAEFLNVLNILIARDLAGAAIALAVGVALLFFVVAKTLKPLASIRQLLVSIAEETEAGEEEVHRQVRLEANIDLLRTLLLAHGEPRSVGESLYFGDRLINGDQGIVDQVSATHGGAATIFLGDVRVATNVVKADGGRAIGTKLAPGAAYETVLGQGKSHFGVTEILGQSYLTIYEPILRDGRVIGILFAGVKRTQTASSSHAAVRAGDEIDEMRAAAATLKAAALAKAKAERDALAQRYAASDAARNADAVQRAAALAQRVVVDALSTALERIAAADLAHRIDAVFPTEYQKLKDDFGLAVSRLRDVLRTIAQDANLMRSHSTEISEAAADLSRRTEEQAASLKETAGSLSQITANVKKTAEGADHARAVVVRAKADAERGAAVVRQAIAAMGGIESSSKQIAAIIGAIDDIALQTNLLALNAGVEAARAGDSGRGFAVVAAEVRVLALRSAEAAKQIKALVAASAAQVEQGVQHVAETGTALERIGVQVGEINKVVTGITDSAQEQAKELHQVNVALGQMDEVTQRNAAMVVQSSAASRKLLEETEALVERIGAFTLASHEEAAPRAFVRRGAIAGFEKTAPAPRRAVAGRSGF
jgi:methyl-accepting chemotaxis protein